MVHVLGKMRLMTDTPTRLPDTTVRHHACAGLPAAHPSLAAASSLGGTGYCGSPVERAMHWGTISSCTPMLAHSRSSSANAKRSSPAQDGASTRWQPVGTPASAVSCFACALTILVL